LLAAGKYYNLPQVRGDGPSVDTGESKHSDAVDEIEAALHLLARSLRQVRLHEFLLAEARVDADQAGLAVLYVLHVGQTSLRLTDLAEQLRIDAPAVTRKAQQLERAGLVSRAGDQQDARVTRLELTAQGRQTINRFLAARRGWLTKILADWPEPERADFARLLRRFTGDIYRQRGDLDE
jgi:DNA-binding MarR family transcriptional regulator